MEEFYGINPHMLREVEKRLEKRIERLESQVIEIMSLLDDMNR